jgi:hypothetical protein
MAHAEGTTEKTLKNVYPGLPHGRCNSQSVAQPASPNPAYDWPVAIHPRLTSSSSSSTRTALACHFVYSNLSFDLQPFKNLN